jgi:hypothetical protein
LGLALLAAGPVSAQPIDISGAWKIQGTIQSGGALFSARPTCVFEQAGSKLSGACIGPNASGPLTGVISGRNVSWTWRNRATNDVGITGMTAFNGVYVDHHLIQGTMTSSATSGEGAFTQTR